MRLAIFLCWCLAAAAQQDSPQIKVNLENFRYPTLAASARIQGDVVFAVSANEQEQLTGHPLLVAVALANLKTWTLPPLPTGRYLVVYHFSLIETGTQYKDVPIGDKLDRFFLRLFRSPTSRMEGYCYSDPSPPPMPRYTARRDSNDTLINVFVFGRCHCPIAD